MINTKFELYKIRRELKKIGVKYEFKRLQKNKFGEFTNNFDGQIVPNSLSPLVIDSSAGEHFSETNILHTIVTIPGIYHEQSSNVSLTTGDTTQTRSKKIPMILCLYDDAKLLKFGDIVKINSKLFKVISVINIQEWNLISDVSLEVVDNGIQT